jgi:hypothetical protein
MKSNQIRSGSMALLLVAFGCGDSAESPPADNDSVGGASGSIASAGGSASGVAGTGGGSAGSAMTGAAGGGGRGGAGGVTSDGGAGGSGGTAGTSSGGAGAPGCSAVGGGGGGAATGEPGVWTHVDLPGALAGDQYQSMARDPVRPTDFYLAAGHNGDHRVIRFWKSTDFGASWVVINDHDIHGDPWGFSIDPNPCRDASTPPTIWSPAGYGDLGAWKSTDGGHTFKRSTAADTAFAPYNPYGAMSTDLYEIRILPDDPPNHVLATYHYGFKNDSSGGFGETWDGGATWVVHPPLSGMGTSHYVIPISGTTWAVISQDKGVFLTTTAGRVGGTPAQKYRDGMISASAWKKVDDMSHAHGSHQNMFLDGAWYVTGMSEAKKTTDGATWQTIASGFSFTGIAATATYLYGIGYGGNLSRAPRSQETKWDTGYVKPSSLSNGPSPYGNISGYDTNKHQWVVMMAPWDTGLWRYAEP